MLVQVNEILTWLTGRGREGLFIYFSSFPDIFTRSFRVFSDVGYKRMRPVSESHTLKAASGWTSLACLTFAEGLTQVVTGGLYCSFQRSLHGRGQCAGSHSFVFHKYTLVFMVSRTNQRLFHSETHKISCEFHFLCVLQRYHSQRVHFSFDTHTGIYLAF